MKMREIKHMGTKMRGKKKIIKGIAMGLCLAMLVPAAAVMMPGVEVEATTNTEDKKETVDDAITSVQTELNDYKIIIDPENKYSDKLTSVINNAITRMKGLQTPEGVHEYASRVKADMTMTTMTMTKIRR